jgi:hypothetical protein
METGIDAVTMETGITPDLRAETGIDIIVNQTSQEKIQRSRQHQGQRSRQKWSWSLRQK